MHEDDLSWTGMMLKGLKRRLQERKSAGTRGGQRFRVQGLGSIRLAHRPRTAQLAIATVRAASHRHQAPASW